MVLPERRTRMAISFTISKKELLTHNTQAYALLITKDQKLQTALAPIQAVFPTLTQYCTQQGFTGASNTALCIPFAQKNSTQYLIIAGLGDEKKEDYARIEYYRRAIAKVVRVAQANKIESIALAIPNNLSCSDEALTHETVVSANMAAYAFNTFKTSAPKERDIALTLVAAKHTIKNLEAGIKTGEIVAHAINNAREWINLPANVLSPEDLAAHAKDMSAAHGLACTIFNQTQIQKMGMGGLYAVARGSARECRLVIMEYACGNKKAPTLCFVGKGLTFDSGGLSLKPAGSMETMKEDMSGAAAVIGAMQALAQLKPAVNIVAITPITENMPGSNATKPGDIVHLYNGKTVEIKNTDAEGRLVLADALAYAVKQYKPTAIIDLATLTGACMRALGPFFSGLFSVNDELAEKIKLAGKLSGDGVWRLPLTDDYEKAVECTVADLRNTGQEKYLAGATTAAVFLKHFVDDTPWAHLDIAGTAFNVPDLPYQRPDMATGTGVRLLVHVAMNWK